MYKTVAASMNGTLDPGAASLLTLLVTFCATIAFSEIFYRLFERPSKGIANAAWTFATT